MSDLKDLISPTFEDEVHDLLLANYLQSRRILDVLYVQLAISNQTFADELLDKHSRNEFIYPDVFAGTNEV